MQTIQTTEPFLWALEPFVSSFGQSSVGYRYEKSVLQSLLSLLSYFATSSDRRSMLGRFVALVLPSGGPTSQDKSHQALLQPGTFLNEGTDTKKILRSLPWRITYDIQWHTQRPSEENYQETFGPVWKSSAELNWTTRTKAIFHCIQAAKRPPQSSATLWTKFHPKCEPKSDLEPHAPAECPNSTENFRDHAFRNLRFIASLSCYLQGGMWSSVAEKFEDSALDKHVAQFK